MLNEAELMHILTISGHYNGFRYLLTGINLALENEDLLHPVSTRLYPLIAQKHGTTVKRVYSAIRNFISAWWKGGDCSFLVAYFDPAGIVPSNKAFIYALVVHVQRTTMKER